MLELPLDKATVKKVGNHQYYVFPAPSTHSNQTNRPPKYADSALLKPYTGAGSNGIAQLLPGDVHAAANAMMTALRCYGDAIDDWSMKSAVIQNGYRADNEAQGRNYLRIIKKTIKEHPDVFGALEFPGSLEQDAQSVLGRPGDPRRTAFHQKVAAAPGWDAKLAAALFRLVDSVYTPRGTNPHATGLVFDLDFTIFDGGRGERKLGAEPSLNALALRSAAGMWLNRYSMMFGFDSYDTSKEIWHQDFRSPKTGDGSPEAIALLNCCRSAPD